jgi:hypothetical protein
MIKIRELDKKETISVLIFAVDVTLDKALDPKRA